MSDGIVQSVPRVLILDGDSKAAAEAALVLSRISEVDVAARSPHSLAWRARRLRRRLLQPPRIDELAQWIAHQDGEHGYHLVVPSTEASLLAVKRSDLPGALRQKCVIPAEDSIDVALDKMRTVELAARLGLRAPRTVLIERTDSAPQASFPLVVKPLRTKIVRNHKVLSLPARICKDQSQREAAHRVTLPYVPVLEQEYFAGRGVGIEALFDHGRPVWIFAHERVHELPVTGGGSTYRRSIAPPPVLEAAAIRLLEALEWHGVAMVEFKVNAGDYCLVEINPRLWGSLPLAVSAGVNFPAGLLALAQGRPAGPQPAYKPSFYMRDAGNDLVWFVDSWTRRRDPLVLKPLAAGDFAAPLRLLVGREGWDLFRWGQPGIWWTATRRALGGLKARFFIRRATRSALSVSRANWATLQADWRAGRLRRVLVLCYGNICRSPVVAAQLSAAVPDVEVASAGFHSEAQRRSPDQWQRVVKVALGIDLEDHRSRVVDEAVLAWADFIVVMDLANWAALASMSYGSLRKTVLLRTAADNDGDDASVADPYDGDEAQSLATAGVLAECVTHLARAREQKYPIAR